MAAILVSASMCQWNLVLHKEGFQQPATDDIFRCIFVNAKFCILIKILLKIVPNGPIDNKPTLV